MSSKLVRNLRKTYANLANISQAGLKPSQWAHAHRYADLARVLRVGLAAVFGVRHLYELWPSSSSTGVRTPRVVAGYIAGHDLAFETLSFIHRNAARGRAVRQSQRAVQLFWQDAQAAKGELFIIYSFTFGFCFCKCFLSGPPGRGTISLRYLVI